METRRILIAGLPESGKTTFLAALWHTLKHGKHPSLQLARIPDNAAYLTSLSMQWLSFEVVKHTTHETKRSTLLQVETMPGGPTFDLELPDLSGESFSNGFELRGWETHVSESSCTSTGLALFVGPKIVDMMLIDDAINIADKIAPPIDDGNTTHQVTATEKPQKATTPSKKWSASDSPTQTYLVDILQQISRERPRYRPLRVSVIASAWDKWMNSSLTPEKWLERTMPLLWQYLESNSARFPWKAYGVSAQGGDYLNAERVRQLEEMDPCERPIVASGTGVSNDLALPLAWFFE